MPKILNLALSCALCLFSSALAGSQRFDFQDISGPVEAGFTRVSPDDSYNEQTGFGFIGRPDAGVNGSRHSWAVFGRRVRVDDALPASVLSNATRDCVVDSEKIEFRADVPPGEYDVTVWVGDVTTPRFQLRITINGVVIDVERMDINYQRGSFDGAIFGNAVPRQARVSAPHGFIHLGLGPHPEGDGPINWTYLQDEDPNLEPYERTVTLVPPFDAAVLQALVIHPASDPPFELSEARLIAASRESDRPEVEIALRLFNEGRIREARAAFEQLGSTELGVPKAAGLFWVAGHPALLDDEPELLAEAEALLAAALTNDPEDSAAEDLLLQVRLARDAERYRRLYGYASAGSPAAENMGRSCSLVEQFQPGHPYYLKGQILWLRNRGGLDPRRVTASWERAQWLARQLDPQWGEVNPHVRLYATDEWENGDHWTVIDWKAAAGQGPEWARSLMGNLNVWLDLFEWWSIHRQAPEGDIGGGWTDDVEIVPAFGLMAFVLHGVSDVCRDAVLRFADGIWNSEVMDRERGYQKQYADVEHTAEPTGNILHLYPLVRFGDPEGMERLMTSASTFADFFLTEEESRLGHLHFRGNHMSSTQIATNPDHRADIPLNGRVTAPFNFLVWYSSNPGIEEPLGAWARSWVEDSLRTENGKPVGVFPNLIWTPTDGIGAPTSGDWWSQQQQFGQYGSFPANQYYLYNLAGFFYLRTGDEQFLEPFHAVQRYTGEWIRAGRPSLGAVPPSGQASIWAGEKLQTIARGPIANLRQASGRSDWDEYLNRFSTGYSAFLLDPAEVSTINDLAGPVDLMRKTWPYRTSEGLMTDRILIPGWADAISYYIGADVFSVFFGMPVFAVTWEDTTRLFAATIENATREEIVATAYLFSDRPRTIGMRFWQLELGRQYILEAGPSDGPGQPFAFIDQSETFVLEHLGERVELTLPERMAYRIQIHRTDSSQGPAEARDSSALPSDLAVRPEDISYDYETGQIRVRIHNIGAAGVESIRISILEGPDATGPLIGTQVLAELDAPTDLVPRFLDLFFTYPLSSETAQVTVVVEPAGDGREVTLENNLASAFIGEGPPDRPAPMLLAFNPDSVRPGDVVTVSGRNFQPDLQVLESGAATESVRVRLLDPDSAELTLAGDLTSGALLISFRNPDGKDSNYLPLQLAPNLDHAHELHFPQFANGRLGDTNIASKIVLLNRNTVLPASVRVEIRDDDGVPVELYLDGTPIQGVADLEIPPRGLRFLEAGAWEPLSVGSMTIRSDRLLAGSLVYYGDAGAAGVSASPAFDNGFISPVESDLLGSLDTGLAIMNLENGPGLLEMSLLNEEGEPWAATTVELPPRGHLARFAGEFNWEGVEDGTVNLDGVLGVLKTASNVRTAAITLQTRQDEFATIPVTSSIAGESAAAAVPAGRLDLLEDLDGTVHFAHFADGRSDGGRITSEIILINRKVEMPAYVTLSFRDQSGGPLALVIDGETVLGEKSVTIPAGGLGLLRTSGEGALAVGSVGVASSEPLAGVVVFAGSTGAAGVGVTEIPSEAFVVPVENDQLAGVSTGIAILNLEAEPVAVALELLDTGGEAVSVATIDLVAGGQAALFIGELEWRPPAGHLQLPDLGTFRGTVSASASGSIAGIGLQTRPGQFVTLPVTTWVE